MIATDFSPGASQAVRIGGLLARALSMPVHLAHVSQDPRASLVIRTSDEHVLAEDRRKLTESAESLAREFGVAVTSELEAGVVVDQVCAVAERHLADVLVIGARGPYTLARLQAGRPSESFATCAFRCWWFAHLRRSRLGSPKDACCACSSVPIWASRRVTPRAF